MTPRVDLEGGIVRKGQRLGYTRPCDQCGTEFRVLPCYVRKAEARGLGAPRFCSRACRNRAYVGEGNPNWRGGRLLQSDGYVLVYAPDHPHAVKGYVLEHRLVMERQLGRVLDPGEVVHHVNHQRADNRPENLEVLPSGSAHRVHHAYYQAEPCGTCGTDVARSVGHRRRWPRAFCSRRCAALAASEAATKARGGTA